MDVSIVIVSWNVREFLRKCLKSVYRFSEGVTFEIFVVDNNSSDGTAGMVENEFPKVHLVANKENLGFGKANNLVLNKTTGRYSLLLNPDTELIENSLKVMVGFMDSHPKAAAMGCKLVFADGSLQYSCRHFPSIFTDLMENLYLDAVFANSTFFNRYKMGFWKHDSMREIDVVYGACLLARKDTLEKISFFDERFFMYYDEIDLCYRIKKTGGKIFFYPGTTVRHYANQSYTQLVFECDQWKTKSKMLFFQKHYGPLGVAALFLNLALNASLTWSVLSVSHFLFKKPRDLLYFKKNIKFIWGEYIKCLNSQ